MSDFKVGDRVRILPGVATPFVGMDGTISEVRPHERGIETRYGWHHFRSPAA